MAIVRYEPFNLLNQLQREMNRLFETTGRGGEEEGGLLLSDWAPAVDIKEEPEHFLLHADIPGVDPKDIEITMERGVLTLKGQRSAETKEETEKYRKMERVRGTFLRSFTLPEATDAEGITAKCHDGVLEVIVPKVEQAQPKRIAVEH